MVKMPVCKKNSKRHYLMFCAKIGDFAAAAVRNIKHNRPAVLAGENITISPDGTAYQCIQFIFHTHIVVLNTSSVLGYDLIFSIS